MQNVKNILLSTDFSENSKTAFPAALAVARNAGATIHLVHAVPEMPAASYQILDAQRFRGLGRDLTQRAEADLEQIAAGLGGVTVQRHVVQGDPAAEITRLVEELDIDLVSIATKGNTGLSRFMLGSVAEKVARTAPCPVLIARETPEAWQHFTKIIVPTDFSDLSKRAITAAARIAEPFSAQIVLTYVVDETQYPVGHVLEGQGLLDAREQTHKAVIARLEELQQAIAKPVFSTCSVVDGIPSSSIADLATEEQADLIVMATHGREGLARWVLGSTAERTARIAPCSVLVVKER